MQYTRNYNLKKPDYTDFADIKDINDNIDKIDEELAAPTGDTADSTATFTCSDVADGDAAAWTNVPALTSGETHKSIFAKMSQMFKNLRYLYKLLGTTDISSIGNGTVTGGLSSLNDSLANKLSTVAVGDAIRLNNIGYNSSLNCLWVSTGTNASVYLPITWQQNDNIKMVTGIIYETNTKRLGIYANGAWHYVNNV